MQLDKPQRLYVFLAAFFCVTAVLAEFIGVKIFALEATLGIAPLEWNLFGQTGSLNFTAGTLLWPIVFVMTDIVNEYFGKRGVSFISWTAVALILYGFGFAYAAIHLAPADWWIGANAKQGVPDLQAVSVSATLEGSYASLMKFINEVERSKLFLPQGVEFPSDFILLPRLRASQFCM